MIMEQFQRYFVDTLKNRYADFKGRASRSEYWYFMLFSLIIGIILAFLDSLIGTAPDDKAGAGILGTIFSIATFIPALSLAIRRLHDIGKKGWWVLAGVIPIVNFIGIFVLLFFFIKDSQPGSNEYGPNPKGM